MAKKEIVADYLLPQAALEALSADERAILPYVGISALKDFLAHPTNSPPMAIP